MRLVDRIRAVPRALSGAPAWLLLPAGLALIVLGLLILTRPLTSLTVLGIYIGISCLVTGASDLVTVRGRPAAFEAASALVWVVVGLAIVAWLGTSLLWLPVAVAVVLFVGGLRDLEGIRRGELSRRVLHGCWGLAQLVFAALVLLWPDVGVLVVAVLFAIRTVVFGFRLLWQGTETLVRRPAADASVPRRVRRGPAWAVASRWVAAAAALALAGTGLWVNAVLRDGVPVIDAFYRPPAQAPDDPGVLVRQEAWPGRAPAGATVQRILHTTTDSNGTQAWASAVVVAPDPLPSGPLPLIIWAHGTTGIAQACAPSLADDLFEVEGGIPAVDQAMQQGWVIVATDYTGQGVAGNFPYLIGQGQARSALDSARAAQQMTGLDLADGIVVWGQSQGGHAALWTGAVAGSYAPELDLAGVAAISPAADPAALAERLLQHGGSGLLAVAVSWVLVPYSQTYDDVVLEDYVAPSGRTLVEEMARRCVANPGMMVSVLDGLAVSRDRPLFDTDLASGPLAERLAQNRTLGPWSAPVLLAWGSRDEVIAADLQHDYVDALCEEAVDLTWHEYPGYDHMRIVRDDSAFLPVLISWTQGRFAQDEPPPRACP